MDKNDGGPAFPRAGFEADIDRASERDTYPQEGMSLRDYFAAHCPLTLTEWVQGKNPDYIQQDTFMLEYAEFRVKYADAMLEALKK